MSVWVYLVRTSRGNLYCGISNDPLHRVQEHNSFRGAKCLRGQLPVKLVYAVRGFSTRGDALRVEADIKTRSRSDKLKLILDQSNRLLCLVSLSNILDAITWASKELEATDV